MEPEDELLRGFARTRDPAVAAELVKRYQHFARAMARRYEGLGEPLEDLVQVASVGLVAAINRFEPEQGVPFLGFATPTILGELRRHFRDRVSTLRVPRSLQERVSEVESTVERLAAELNRSPTVSEIATEARLTDEEVLEAVEARASRRIKSLDVPVSDEDGDGTLGGTLGDADGHFELVEDWETVSSLMQELSPTQVTILKLRFVDELTQSEIGRRVGYSQMQVSRTLRRTLDTLRESYEESMGGPG